MRKPVVGVMGGSKATPAVFEMARRLGRLIAEQNWILLNGGRDSGVMAASAAGAQEAGGLVIGVLPGTTTTRTAAGVSVAIVTGLGDGRNAINVMSSDVVVACRGSLGTLSEIVLALKHHKRVILLDCDVGKDFDAYRKRGQLTWAATPEDAVAQVAVVVGATRSD